ncbi:MAG: TRL-like family protein [Lentisphaeria bacterium]|jgi:hypothetical protein|nr:TRL-like family protein [Lentisphaeria bacterium]
MRRTFLVLGCVAAVGLLSGCATSFPVGSIFTEVSLPVAVTSQGSYSKVGRAQCESILGLVAIGDASIEQACKNGNITKIHHVDWKARNILGVIGKYECVVYGE